MKNPLIHGLVNSGDGCLVGGVSLLAVPLCNSSVELLDGGLERGLVHLVSLVGDLGKSNSLLRGLDIGHGLHLLRWRLSKKSCI